MRVGLVSDNQLVKKDIRPCPAKGTKEEVLHQLEEQIAQLMNSEVTSIGVGVPSVVDCIKGIVYNVANIPSWDEVHLKALLEERFGIPVQVNNDANCFALGVWNFGEGQESGCSELPLRSPKNMVGLTMGTGIGAGIIIDGHLYNGLNTCAGEIGSLPFKDADYEFYCSSRFFTHCHGETGKTFHERAIAGDEHAKEVWREFGSNVGELIKAVMFTFAPDSIIIGGGIASAFPLFETSMKETIASFPNPAHVRETRNAPSTLADAALLGASTLI